MTPAERDVRRVERRAQVERDGKYCRGPCQRRRPANDYAARNEAVDGRMSWCRECTSEASDKHRAENPKRAAETKRARYAGDPETHRAKAKAWREANPEKWRKVSLKSQRVTAWATNLVSHCRTRSKVRGWPACDLTGDYLLGLFEQQGGRCYWLGVPMVPSTATRDPRRPSVDRLVPALGYVEGNVVLSTAFANLGRSVLAADKFAAFIAELKDQMRAP